MDFGNVETWLSTIGCIGLEKTAFVTPDHGWRTLVTPISGLSALSSARSLCYKVKQLPSSVE